MQVLENFLHRPLTALKKYRVGRFVSWIFVFLFVSLAWVFFRAPTFADAIHVIGTSLEGIGSLGLYISNGLSALGFAQLRLAYMAAIFLVAFVVDALMYKSILPARLANGNRIFRRIIFLLLALLVILFAQKGTAGQFVYFKF